jgi:enediyne polyketide synthase
MLDDAGYVAADLPQSKAQSILGNTLTGEFTRYNMLRLRWPCIQKTLRQNGKQLGLTADQFAGFTQRVEAEFKSISPATNEDCLAGGFTVDAACSSSLILVYTAATHLANNSIDFSIAGGVDVSLDPFELIGLAKTGALTQSDMMFYDKRGSGFILGEGCGIVGM